MQRYDRGERDADCGGGNLGAEKETPGVDDVG